MSPEEIVAKMLDNDPYSQWLGVEVVSIEKGDVVVQAEVKSQMLNGFSVAHGGITYALSDSSLAFSANTHGRHAVSIETSISHIAPVFEGDILTTKVQEVSHSNKIGIYHVDIVNQHDVIVSNFKGTVFFKSNNWQ